MRGRILAALMAFATIAVTLASPAFAANVDFSGNWETWTDKNWTYKLTLEQNGRQVDGSYVAQDGSNGEIHGIVKGNVLRFEWSQDGGFRGTGQFSMKGDDSFAGVYQAEENAKLGPNELQGSWFGKRNSKANFSGVWDTITDKGWTYKITLRQKGKRVSGTYIVQDGSQGSISGEVNGRSLSFEWEQDGGFTGEGQFSLATDGASFSGVYSAEPQQGLAPEFLQGTWKGNKIQ